MCKFCNAIEKDGAVMPERVLSEHQLGKFKCMTYVDGNTIELASIEIGNEESYDPFFNNVSIPINFCPICGRRLEKV